MAKPWKEVAESNEFKSLALDQQRAARDEYFKDVVEPRVPPAERDAAYNEFKTDSNIPDAYEGSEDSGWYSAGPRAAGNAVVDTAGTALQGAGIVAARESRQSARRKDAALQVMDMIDSMPDLDDDSLNAALQERGLGSSIPSSPSLSPLSARMGIAAQPNADFAAADASAETQKIMEYRTARALGDKATTDRLRSELTQRFAEETEAADPTSQPAFRGGASVRRFADAYIPLTPEEEERWYNKYLFTPVGQTAGFAATGALAGPAGVAATGALVGGASNYEQDIARGATTDQALDAAGINLLAGTSEALPIERMLHRVPGLGGVADDVYDVYKREGLKQAGKYVGKNVVSGAVEEGAQEAFQQGASNYAAKQAYDPNRGVFDGMGDASAEGAGAGAVLSGLASLLPGRERGGAPALAPTNAPPAAPAEQPIAAAPEYGPVNPTIPDSATMNRELDQVLNTDRPIDEIIQETDFPDKLPEEEVIPMTEGGDGSEFAGYAYYNPATGNVRYPNQPHQPKVGAKWQDIPDNSELPPGTQTSVNPETGVTQARATTSKTPMKVETAEDLQQATAAMAASSPENDLPEPTQAQKEAGNYRKAHVNVQGLNISVETPRGGERNGTDSDGKPWSVTMPADYGYIKRSSGADDEQVDVYVGQNPKSKRVFIVDQFDPTTGKFDEHKVMIGFPTAKAALETYDAAFSDGSGSSRIGGISGMDMSAFKTWLKDGDGKKPYSKSSALPVARAAEPQSDAAPAQSNAPIPRSNPAEAPSFRDFLDENNEPTGWQWQPMETEDGPTGGAVLVNPQTGEQRTFTGKYGVTRAAEFVKSTTSEKKAPAPAAEEVAPKGNMDGLHNHFLEQIRQGKAYTSIQQARKEAADYLGAPVKPNSAEAKQVDEQVEVANTVAARRIVESGGTPNSVYDRLVTLYNNQPILGQRSSTSVENQAYSTPAPIAYVASRLAGIDNTMTVLEPTVGNGALLLTSSPDHVTAYEIDNDRIAQVRRVLPRATINPDGNDFLKVPVSNVRFDAVITNPPFGKIPNGGAYPIGSGSTNEIDQAIALKALSQMDMNGRAALIIGSKRGLSKDEANMRDKYNTPNGRLFFKHLYDNYNVTDHFSLDGSLYKKQGAGYPIDIIIIDGKGKSELPLPGVKAPRLYKSFDQIKELLNADQTLHTQEEQSPSTDDSGLDTSANARDSADSVPERDSVAAARADKPATSGRSAADNSERVQRNRPERQSTSTREAASVGSSDSVSPVGAGAVESGSANRSGEGRSDSAPAQRDRDTSERAPKRDVANSERSERVLDDEKVSDSGLQVTYKPTSTGQALDTLVPVKMKSAIDRALKRIAADVGDIDQYVTKELGYSSTEELHKHFAAEQIEAIALAIRNIDQGAGFIIGDQTGIGKGRVNAAILRYARIKGKVPIFVTKDPGLYGDMYRDLSAIGERNFKAFITNGDIKGSARIFVEETGDTIESLPKAEYDKALKHITEKGSLPKGYDYLFTTYSQLQPVGGKGTPRHKALESAMFNSIISFDESHDAGGAGQKAWKKKREEGQPEHYDSRAVFARHLIDNADGVMYSSATYAKSPEVMDLYRKTDIRLAVDDIKNLSDTIRAGGVPLQQVIANMLVESGQYVRREKSFDGVKMDLAELPADLKQADAVAEALNDIFEFDTSLTEVRDELKEEFRERAGAAGKDNAIGVAGLSNTNFSSIMHNIVGQALVAQKIPEVARRAVEIHKSGVKPLIALSNTNESFLRDFMDEAGLSVGDVAEGLSFNRLLQRYLERTRVMTEKDSEGNIRRVRLSDDQIGPERANEYRRLTKKISKADFGNAPVSPIDYLRTEMEKAGMKVGEVTGRNLILVDKDGSQTIETRDPSPAEKKKTIGKFNGGEIDALILNRSGSTGYSMHANKTFKDRKPRRMLVLQAEPNIDTYMQMLGRIHRTGQVELPAYDIVISNIPVERRPAAILMKKLASLNANTTANKRGATTIDSVVDFMNPYGDALVVELLKDEPNLRHKVNMSIPSDMADISGMAAQLTGRLAILPVKEQARVLDLIEGRYKKLIEYLDQTGENVMEAKELDLKADTTGTIDIEDATGESPFAGAVKLEETSVRRLGKPYTLEQIDVKVERKLDGKSAEQHSAALKEEYKADTDAEWKRIQDRWDAAQRDNKDVEKARGRFKMAQDLRKIIENFLDKYRVGEIVTLKSDEGNLHGVIIDISRDSSASPVALSQFNVTLAVADAIKEVTIPLSQVSKRPDSDKAPRYELTKSYMNRPELKKLFDIGQNDIREKRYIATGNLLRAFDKFRQGKIVFFTRKDGKMDQGILMPRSFEANEEVGRLTLSLRGHEEAAKLLRQVQGARVITTDGNVTVERDSTNPGLYKISVNRRARGLVTSGALREALGADLYSRSGDFTQTFSPDKLPAIYKAIEIAGSRWAVRTNQDAVREMRGEEPTLKFQRKEGESGPATGHARIYALKNWTDKRVSMATKLEKLARDRFGEHLNIDFASKIFDDKGKEVFGAFTVRPGQNGTVEYWATVSLSEGSTDPIGTLNHEGIHFLRAAGAFDDATWAVLKQKAYSEWIQKYNIRKLYRNDNGTPTDEEIIVEEAIAEAYADKARWNAFPQKVRSAFRKIEEFIDGFRKILVGEGFRKASDVFSNISSGKFAKSARTSGPIRMDTRFDAASPKYQRVDEEESQKVTATKAFKKWFEDSKVVDDSGNPLVVYHGTGEDFESFEVPAYFTDEPSFAEMFADEGRAPNIVPVYLSIKNPYKIDGDKEGRHFEWDADDVKEMKNKGYDGVIVTSTDGSTIYTIFDKNQVKSINNRSFNKSDGRILFQRRDDEYTAPLTLSTPDRGILSYIRDENLKLVDRLKGATSKSAAQVSLDNWRRGYQDRFLHFYRVQKRIEELTGEPLSENMDVYGAEETFSGRAGAKLEKLERDHKNPLIQKIADFNNKYGDGIETIEKFLYAQHAPERNAQIAKINPEMPEGGSGMSNEEAEAIIETAKETGTYNELREIAKGVHKMLDESLSERVKMGLMDQQSADNWRQYKYYVPLRGLSEVDAQATGTNIGRGLDVRGPESKRAEGRRSKANDILAHAFAIADEAIIRGEKNRVEEKLYNLVTANPDPKVWEITTMKRTPVVNKATGLVEYRATPLPKNAKLNDFTVGVKINGVQKLITLHDKRLATPMKNLEIDKVDGLWRALMVYNRFLSHVNTTLNPEFLISNAFRDVQTATINLAQYDMKGLSKDTARDYFKALKGTWGALNGKEDTEWQKYFREYESAGGKVSFWRPDDLGSLRTRLKREVNLRKKGVIPMTARGARAAIDFVETSNLAVENAIRLSAYVNARRRGMSEQQAARLAKNLTVNFNKRGDHTTKVNALYLFYNASIQGSFVILNALRSRRVRKIAVAIVAMGFAEHFMNMMLSPQDDDDESLYDKIPQYVKEGNMIIMDPTGKLGNLVNGIFPVAKIEDVQYVKIPMPYGYRVFHEFGRNVAAMSSGSETKAEGLSNIASSLINNFNPIGGSGQFWNVVAPTVADPLVDIAFNRNFADKKIQPEPSPYDRSPPPPSERYFPNVSEASKWVAREMNEMTGGDKIAPGMVSMSPEVLDHFFEQFTGAAGAFLGRTVDSVAKGFTGEEITVNDAPIVRKMFGANNQYFDRSTAYDRMRDIESISGRHADYIKSGMRDKANELRAENAEVLKLKGIVDNTQEKLSGLRKRKVVIENHRVYTDEQKKEQLKRIEEMENRVVQDFNRRYLKAVRADGNIPVR